MVRRVFSRSVLLLILFIMLLIMPAYAEGDLAQETDHIWTDLNMSDLSVENLLDLRERIDSELKMRGVVSYFDLELNSKGEDVANLQKRLYELGYYVGNITGKYDSATRQAEKQFEKNNHLENDGVASQHDQKILYSEAAIPKSTPAPRSEKTKEPETALKIDINESLYGEFDYEDTMRYPENHKGEKVKLTGKVVQVMGSRTSGFQIRFSISGSSDVVYVYINDVEYNILENDRMTIYATVKGTKTYSSILGQSITIPSLAADCVILKN